VEISSTGRMRNVQQFRCDRLASGVIVGRHTTEQARPENSAQHEGCYLVLSLSSEFSKAEFCSGVTSLLDLEVENKLADLETERTVTYQVRPLEIRFQFILALHCKLLIHFQIRALSIPT
jgi:hypothetical protein